MISISVLDQEPPTIGDIVAPVRTETSKYTITLDDNDLENLKIIQEHTGVSANDTVRKALATEAQIQIWLAKGNLLLVGTRWRRFRQVVWK